MTYIKKKKPAPQESASHPRVIGLDVHSQKLAAAVFERSTELFANSAQARLVCHKEGTVEALEALFKKIGKPGDIVVLEATTNAFVVAERLRALSLEAIVVKSTTLSSYSESDRVNDRIDAENLARAYIDGKAEVVYCPTGREALWRELCFFYRNATKDTTRCSNRIWAFCSRHGFAIPQRSRKKKCEEVRAQVSAKNWTDEERFVIENLIEDYTRAVERRERILRQIGEIVSRNPSMLRVMKILGVRTITAFFFAAFIGNVRRFENGKKLVRYIGLNPRVCDSGEDVGRNRPISHRGRGDLRSILIQCAQAALCRGKSSVHRWARGKLFGKPRGVVVCALARKLAMFIWHALMGHACPEETPQGFTLKLTKLSSLIGRERLRELGFEKASAFIAHLSKLSAAPPPQPNLP